jgi:hypothetical protein
MAGYKLPGVCGINPVSSISYDADSLFPSNTHSLSGPVCSVLNPTTLYVSVFNNYDPTEGIDCYLEIYDSCKLVTSRRINKNESLIYKVEINCPEKVASFFVTINSLSKYGKIESKENLGIESGITKAIVAFKNRLSFLSFGISRKESVLHDFLMKFHVKGNPSVKGGKPIYELDSMSDVAKHSHAILSEAERHGVDPDFVKAIMYMETTHGYYDVIPALVDKNTSILPMNVRSGYWNDIGFTRSELKKVKNNISAGVYLIKKLSERVTPYSIEGLASLYQDLGATEVTEYGARVKQIYDRKLWIPRPGFLEKINMEVNRFESLPQVEQVSILRRLFGGF